MNRNYLIGFAAAAAVLGLLAFLAWTFLEVYPRTKYVPPSREAGVNDYLALDRWLEGMGISVRAENSGNLSMISRAEERQIFIQVSLFPWTDEAVEYLLQWIEEGGHLFLAVDTDPVEDWYSDPELLFEEFGIEVKAGAASSEYDSESPSYDRRVSFEFLKTPAGEALLLKNRGDSIKLVQVNRGKGRLTVTGRPLFLQSWRLERAPNARLAWALFAADFAADTGNTNAAGGWLFIRGTAKARGILGSLLKHGNLLVLAVSVLVLLVVCFWAVIPMFGLVRRDDERPGKPLRERFLAEGRFLKRYGALDVYRSVYIRQIKRRLAHKEGLSTDDEFFRRVLDIWGRPAEEKDSRLLESTLRGEPVKYREFPAQLNILKIILERI